MTQPALDLGGGVDVAAELADRRIDQAVERQAGRPPWRAGPRREREPGMGFNSTPVRRWRRPRAAVQLGASRWRLHGLRDPRIELRLRHHGRGPHVGELSHLRQSHAAGELPRGAQEGEHRGGDLHRVALHRDRAGRRERAEPHAGVAPRGAAAPRGAGGHRAPARHPARPAPTTTPASATPVSALARTQQRREAAKADHKYDDTFRRYSKRWFGAAFDWHGSRRRA